jgi:hypothetical protein
MLGYRHNLHQAEREEVLERGQSTDWISR